MPTKETIAHKEQLAHSRQEIAIWLKEHPFKEPNKNTDKTASKIRNSFAELLIIYIADRMLRRSFELQFGKSVSPNINLAKDLLQTVTREKPGLMLGLAVIAGAGLTASRPWRWLAKKGTWIDLLSQLVFTGIAHVLEKKNSK